MSKQLPTFFLCKAAAKRVWGSMCCLWGKDKLHVVTFEKTFSSGKILKGILIQLLSLVLGGMPALSQPLAKGWTLVPEYAPSQAVIVSSHIFAAEYHGAEILKGLALAQVPVLMIHDEKSVGGAFDIIKILRSVNGGGNVRMIEAPHEFPWIRDFGPLFLKSRTLPGTGKDQIIVGDLGFNDGRLGLQERFPRILSRKLGLKRANIPISLDGGNLVANSRGDCILSQDHVIFSSLEKSLQQYLGCKKVFLIEDAPHRHADMYVKFISDQVLLVAEVSKDIIDHYRTSLGFLPLDIQELSQKLERTAKMLQEHFKVVRIPMAPEHRGVFRTYINSVLVNQSVFLPKYRNFGWTKDPYPDVEFLPKIEAQVKKIYEDHGFMVHFVNSDALAFNGGALHCIMLQLPLNS